LVKAILGEPTIVKTGQWHCPKRQEIGYLDQHYQTLDPEASVFEIVEQEAFVLDVHGIRKHLNNFLFRKNEEVKAKVKTLSGGEKARLSLAQIAACNPKLVILDEMTNNVDLATREHIIQVFSAYPGALIVISHDTDFLRRINVTSFYQIKESKLHPVTS
jgi:ATPase subunit of ABC transporter with duplicated ATPase domains